MVRRLIEQQSWRSREQDPGQLNPPPLTAGERPDRLVEHSLGQPEIAGNSGRFRFCGVAAGSRQLGLCPRVRAHGLVPEIGRVVAHGQLGST
jgi:hypothetical protein